MINKLTVFKFSKVSNQLDSQFCSNKRKTKFQTKGTRQTCQKLYKHVAFITRQFSSSNEAVSLLFQFRMVGEFFAVWKDRRVLFIWDGRGLIIHVRSYLTCVDSSCQSILSRRVAIFLAGHQNAKQYLK